MSQRIKAESKQSSRTAEHCPQWVDFLFL